jgi:hypothetical protein
MDPLAVIPTRVKLTKCSSGLPSHQLALITVAARQPLNMALDLQSRQRQAGAIVGKLVQVSWCLGWLAFPLVVI